ncbi:lipopolysaccharide export system protein LptC [Rhizobiales bacterium GAS191]|jgi:lipopolysaccharide export system protein LptC|nr:lipopolysaccharide export system protein LptC [Rhizobiales bacterium GAS191]SED15471.1 lipopolysaccharide export system protein LptC [Rhizobiales bacterium GAS188]
MTTAAMRPADGRFDVNDGVPEESSGARDFARATRHSARVRLLRRAIPVGVVIAVAGLLAVWLFDPFRQILPANFSVQGFNLSTSQVTMQMPKLAGFKKDNRPYEVVAKQAIQDVSKPSVINLVEMDAHLVLESGQSANLTAKQGIYDTQNETLEVKTDVRVKTTSGYDIRLEQATMKFKTGDINSSKPVNVKMSDGEISADGLEMVDNGKRVTFIGNVRSRLEPTADGAPSKQQAAVKQELRP